MGCGSSSSKVVQPEVPANQKQDDVSPFSKNDDPSGKWGFPSTSLQLSDRKGNPDVNPNALIEDNFENLENGDIVLS